MAFHVGRGVISVLSEVIYNVTVGVVREIRRKHAVHIPTLPMPFIGRKTPELLLHVDPIIRSQKTYRLKQHDGLTSQEAPSEQSVSLA